MSLNAQTLVSQVNPSSVILTAAEQNRYNTYFDSTGYSAKYLVSIDSIENFLSGNQLTIRIPLTSTPITFITNNAVSHADGGIYWTGYSSDESYFRIGRYPEGTILDMYVRSLDKKFSIMSISSTHQVLAVYEDWSDKEDTMACGNSSNQPDDDEEEDDVYDDEDEEGDKIEPRSPCDYNNIRVLVLFTPGAPAEGNPFAVARNLIDEINASVTASGIKWSDINFILANTVELTGFIESGNAVDDIETLRNSTIAQGLRDDNLADIVILLTRSEYGNTLGIAHDIRAKEENAYCLATLDATVNNFTGTHEIGHIIGCRHERCDVCCANPDDTWTYAHAFTAGNDSRTVMHTEGCGRIRIGLWSNRTITFGGEDTGERRNDNVRRLKVRAAKVACFREGTPSGPPLAPRFLFYVDGDNMLCANPNIPSPYTVLFDANAFPSPTFQWEVSANGLTNWYIPSGLVNNGSSCILPDPSFLPAMFFLRITIVASNAYTENFVMMITQYENPTGDCILMMNKGNQNSSEIAETFFENNLQNIHISPNPSKGIFNIAGLVGELKIEVFTMEGKLIRSNKMAFADESTFQLELTDNPKGTYLVKIKNTLTNEEVTHKIILL